MALTQAATEARASATAAAGKKNNKSNPVPDTVPVNPVNPSVGILNDFHVAFPYDSKLKSLHDQVIRWIREVSSSGNIPKGDYPVVQVKDALTVTG